MSTPRWPSLTHLTHLTGLTILMWGCEGGGAPAPETVAACAALAGATEREECRYRLVEPLLADPAALQAALKDIAEPESRDLLLLRLATRHPDKASLLCRQVTTAAAREKCQQVLGRPHLSTRPRPQ